MKPEAKEREFLRRVGGHIRKARHERGLTLEEMEARGFPTWQHLQRIESGKNFNVSTLWRIARALRMPIAELLEGL